MRQEFNVDDSSKRRNFLRGRWTAQRRFVKRTVTRSHNSKSPANDEPDDDDVLGHPGVKFEKIH